MNAYPKSLWVAVRDLDGVTIDVCPEEPGPLERQSRAENGCTIVEYRLATSPMGAAALELAARRALEAWCSGPHPLRYIRPISGDLFAFEKDPSGGMVIRGRAGDHATLAAHLGLTIIVPGDR